jgi:hypothetical protein
MRKPFRWTVRRLQTINRKSKTRGPITRLFKTILSLADRCLVYCPWRKVSRHTNKQTNKQTDRQADPAGKQHHRCPHTRSNNNSRATTTQQQQQQQQLLPSWFQRLDLRGTNISVRVPMSFCDDDAFGVDPLACEMYARRRRRRQ